MLVPACNGGVTHAPRSDATISDTSASVLATIPGPNSVGLVGCSMTVDAAEGARRLGGTVLWPPRELGYGRGSVARWSEIEDGDGFWERLGAALDREPATEGLWWQLCTNGSEDDDSAHALIVMSELEERLPGVSIYVSAQPAYADGHVCTSAGPDGPGRMQELAVELVETGRVEQGPVFSPLRPDQLVDSCHAGEEGKEQMGRELLRFFEGEPPGSG